MPALAIRDRESAHDLVRLPACGTDSKPMASLVFVAGPNVRRGARIDSPCRLVDLTPTLLDMVGSGVRMDHFDGQPIRGFYQPDVPHLPTPMFSQHLQQSSQPIQPTTAVNENNLSSKIAQLSRLVY